MTNYTRKCSNCGKIGHVFRSCNVPTESVGIIAFRNARQDRSFYDEKFEYLEKKQLPISQSQFPIIIDNRIRVACIRRKNTYEFVDFVKGKWIQIYRKNKERFVPDERVIGMLCRMTHSELNIIFKQSFRNIWRNFWCNYNFGRNFQNAESIFKRERPRILRLYEKNKKRIRSTCPFFPPWELPKGRKNGQESQLDCAYREFVEEMGYLRNDFYTYPDCKSIEERYKSTDDKWYSNHYFLAQVLPTAPKPIVNRRKGNVNQVGEIGDVGWFTFHQVCQLINRVYKLEVIYSALVTVQNQNKRRKMKHNWNKKAHDLN